MNQENNNAEKDGATVHIIKQGLNSLENVSIQSPDLQWFEQFVRKEKLLIRRKLIKDLLLFIVCASLILSGVVISLYQIPAVFIALQIGTTFFIAIYTMINIKRKVEADER